MKKEDSRKILLKLVDHEKRYFRYHWRRIRLDTYGNEICRKINQFFDQDFTNLHQALWMYHNANKMFIKTIEASKFPWKTRERALHERNLLALKGFMYKDLLQWQKSS